MIYAKAAFCRCAPQRHEFVRGSASSVWLLPHPRSLLVGLVVWCSKFSQSLQTVHRPNNNASVFKSLAVQRAFIAEFGVSKTNCTMSAGDPAPSVHELCQFEVDWQPAGPFTTAQYSFFVPPAKYEATVSWTMKHRQGLDVLVHPNSGCEPEDHTGR